MMRSFVDKRIVFDLDDTLYLERDFARSGFAALERHVTADHGAAGFGTACQRLFDQGQRGDIFDRACAEMGLDLPIPDLVARYRTHRPEIALCPDAARYLTAGKGPFGLITDGPEQMQRGKIAALSLERFCDQIIPTGQWPKGFGKPHPRAYEAIAAQADGRRCVYVADNAAKDFLAPNRMGWITVQIRRAGRIHPGAAPDVAHAAQIEITSLDQLDQALTASGD